MVSLWGYWCVELRLSLFHGVRGCSSNGVHHVGFGLVFLVVVGLRYRLLWFGGHGLKSWLGIFGEVGVEV